MELSGIPQNWRTASYSGKYSCVEIGRVGNAAAIRDTKNRDAGFFTASHSQWQSFMDAVKAKRFEA